MEPTRLLSLCPECGLATDPEAPVLGHAAMRKRLPWYAVLLAVVGLGVWCWAGYEEFSFGRGPDTGGVPDVVRPLVTREALDAIADGRPPVGEIDAKTLIRTLEDVPAIEELGTKKLSVGWVRPGGTIVRRFALGWPSTFLRFFRSTAYSDAVDRKGRIDCVTDVSLPRDAEYWNFDHVPKVPPHPLIHVYTFFTHGIQVTLPPEWAAGDLVECQFEFEGLGLMALAVVLASWVWPRALRLYCSRTGRSMESRWARRLNRRRAGAMLGLVGFLAVSAFFAAYSTQPRIPDLQAMQNALLMQQAGAPLNGGGPQLHEVPGTWPASSTPERADAARELARAIIKVLDGAQERSNNRYLAASAVAEAVEDPTTSRSIFVPRSLPLIYITESRYVRRAEFGPVEPMAYPRKFAIHGLEGVEWSSGQVGDPRRVVFIMPGRLCAVVLGIVGIWWVTMMFSTGRFSRAYRRRLRGQCAGCGYSVVAGTVEAAEVQRD